MERKTVRLREEHVQRIEETPAEPLVPSNPRIKGPLPFKSRHRERHRKLAGNRRKFSDSKILMVKIVLKNFLSISLLIFICI